LNCPEEKRLAAVGRVTMTLRKIDYFLSQGRLPTWCLAPAASTGTFSRDSPGCSQMSVSLKLKRLNSRAELNLLAAYTRHDKRKYCRASIRKNYSVKAKQLFVFLENESIKATKFTKTCRVEAQNRLVFLCSI
jgi:hypothetical protein